MNTNGIVSRKVVSESTPARANCIRSVFARSPQAAQNVIE
jgi:hypothetical protein